MSVTFNFNATVQQSVDQTILAGDNVQGSCVFDPTQTGTAGNYNYEGSSKTHDITFKDYRGGAQITSDQGPGSIGGYFTIIINGTTMTINSVTIAGRNFQLILTNPSHTGTSLPTSMTGWNITSCKVNMVSGF